MHIDLAKETVVTVNQAAKHFGLSPSMVWRLVLQGRVPSVKIGGARRLTLESFARAFQSSTDIERECEDEGI